LATTQTNSIDWWRYHNVYVTTSDANRGKFVGLCGDYDGSAGDDVVTQAALISQYTVPGTVNLTDGSGIAVISPGTPLGFTPNSTLNNVTTPYRFEYSTSTTLATFRPAVSSSCQGINILTPPPNNTDDGLGTSTRHVTLMVE
jgi:hypothetical protein